MAETVQIIIEGVDKASGPFAKVRKSLDEVNRSASSSKAPNWMGDAKGLEDLSAGFDKLKADAEGVRKSYQDLGKEADSTGSKIKLGLMLAGAAAAAVAIAAARAGWELGAAALKAQAIARDGADARTSVDELASSFDRLEIKIGKALAPTVDKLATGMLEVVDAVNGTTPRIKELDDEMANTRAEMIRIAPAAVLFSTVLGQQMPYVEELTARYQRLNDELNTLYGLSVVTAGLMDLGDRLGRSGYDFATHGVTSYTNYDAQFAGRLAANKAYGDAERKRIAQTRADEEAAIKELTDAHYRAAQEAADAWVAAMNKAADRIKGYVETALGDAIKNAQDLTPGGFKAINDPGANGPFENVYRAMDVLKWRELGKGDPLAKKSPWEGQFAGMDPAVMGQAVADFKNGIMSEAAKSLIDIPGLIDQVKMQEMAFQMRESFALEIAKAAGANPQTSIKVINGLLGVDTEGTNEKGEATGPLTNGVKKLAASTIEAWHNKEADFKAAGKQLLEDGLVAGMDDATNTIVTKAVDIIGVMIDAMIDALNEAKDRAPATTTVTPGGITTPVPAMAGGGNVRVGGTALVGERGPELLTLPRGAQVAPLGAGGAFDLDELAALLAAQPIYVQIDGERVATVVRSKLRLRGAGGMGW